MNRHKIGVGMLNIAGIVILIALISALIYLEGWLGIGFAFVILWIIVGAWLSWPGNRQ